VKITRWEPFGGLDSFRREEKKKQYHRVERSYGMFHRVIPLPSTVDAGKIFAEYNKGVLEIHLPKKADAKAKEIPITVKK
jgi:HSP20 family protein